MQLPSVGEFVDFLIGIRGLDAKANNVVGYQSRYARLLSFFSEWSESEVHRYIVYRRKHFAPATVNNDIKMLRHIDVYMKTFHTRAIRFVPVEKRAPKYMLERDFYTFLDTHPPQKAKRNRYSYEESMRRYDAYFLFAFITGCRTGEICNLLWDHVYPDKVHIIDTKSKKERVIMITQELYQKLCELPRHEYVFGNDQGRMDRTSAMKQMRERLKILGWDKVITRLHDFRSSTATNMSRNGAGLEEIQEYLGHENIQTTRRYVEYDDEHLRMIAGYAPYGGSNLTFNVIERMLLAVSRIMKRSAHSVSFKSDGDVLRLEVRRAGE